MEFLIYTFFSTEKVGLRYHDTAFKYIKDCCKEVENAFMVFYREISEKQAQIAARKIQAIQQEKTPSNNREGEALKQIAWR